jgi:hypothetical protein
VQPTIPSEEDLSATKDYHPEDEQAP